MIGKNGALLIFFGVFLLCYMLFFGLALYARKESPESYPKEKKFDERQLADQMKAVKYGFLTMLVYLVF